MLSRLLLRRCHLCVCVCVCKYVTVKEKGMPKYAEVHVALKHVHTAHPLMRMCPKST